ncbi:MAG TPA: hypothetical protein VGD08_08615 [Stellaceae bacterium]
MKVMAASFPRHYIVPHVTLISRKAADGNTGFLPVNSGIGNNVARILATAGNGVRGLLFSARSRTNAAA